MEFKYQGIILSKIDIAEVDRFYNIYTREAGKIHVVGRGVRNPNAKLAGSLEPVTLSEISVSRGKGKGKITGALAVENFLAIKSDYYILSRVFYTFGIIEKLITAEEKDERVFELILDFLTTSNSLETGNDETNKMDIITLGFLFKLLDLLGYGMNMERCVGCAQKLTPENNYFSATSGGIFCSQCRGFSGQKVKITSGAIKLIRLFLKNKINNLVKLTVSKEDIRNAKIIAGEMVRWITE